MTVTVRQVAEWVNGVVDGDDTVVVHAARPLSDAGPGDVTLIDGDKNVNAWHACPAAAALATPKVSANGRPVIHVADPLTAFATIVLNLRGTRPPAAAGRIDPLAAIHPTAQVGDGVTIGPFVSVGEGARIGAGCHLYAGAVVGRFCVVGAWCVLHPHAVLYEGVTLGDRVILHANVVIGADGFGYRPQAGRHVKVPQVGGVEIGDDVEVGAGSTVDAGTFAPTTIGTGTKIDNLVHVAHNCKIGRHNLFAGQVGIAGSCTTGDYVVMAGQVGIGDHIGIGDRAVIGAQAGVMKDVPADAHMLGSPANPLREQLKIFMALHKLPELRREVAELRRQAGPAPAGAVGGAEE